MTRSKKDKEAESMENVRFISSMTVPLGSIVHILNVPWKETEGESTSQSCESKSGSSFGVLGNGVYLRDQREGSEKVRTFTSIVLLQ